MICCMNSVNNANKSKKHARDSLEARYGEKKTFCRIPCDLAAPCCAQLGAWTSNPEQVDTSMRYSSIQPTLLIYIQLICCVIDDHG